MFVKDPFDIAPRAKRYTPAAWVALALSVAFAAGCTWLLARSWQAAATAHQELGDLQRSLKDQGRKRALALAERAREPADAARARLELQRTLNLSWSGLFDLLEGATKAVDGRVTIAALAPLKLRPEGAEVGITALAVTSDAMLQYLRFLDADARVREVQLVSQRPATVAGVAAIRFEASLVLSRPKPVPVLARPSGGIE